MLSPQLRKKVCNLWNMFWASGMTNPLVAIEQITYLLFLKQLEALDAQRIREGCHASSSLQTPYSNETRARLR